MIAAVFRVGNSFVIDTGAMSSGGRHAAPGSARMRKMPVTRGHSASACRRCTGRLSSRVDLGNVVRRQLRPRSRGQGQCDIWQSQYSR